MMKMSVEQCGQDPSLEVVPGVDMVGAVAAPSAPSAAFFTVSEAQVLSTEVNFYATTTVHC